MPLLRTFYLVKPLIPRPAQILLRRQMVGWKRRRCADVWPILPEAGLPPAGWKGWPEGKRFAVVLTHDVETEKGQARCRPVAEAETALGFRSSFNFVPERYRVDPTLRGWLGSEGFEVGVHGLCHDGKYFHPTGAFEQRARRINHYIREWGAKGFRAPSMLHDLDALHRLDIEYDASTFDTDPFEPQSDGVGTIFPFLVPSPAGGPGYVELPYTLPQDFTLFCLMRERGIGIWKDKLAWIAERGGMALVIVHPDYLHFGSGQPGPEEYPVSLYLELLHHLRDRYAGQFVNLLPREVAAQVQASLPSP